MQRRLTPASPRSKHRRNMVVIACVFVAASMLSGAVLSSSLGYFYPINLCAAGTDPPAVGDAQQEVSLNEEKIAHVAKPKQQRTPAKVNTELIQTLFEGLDPFHVVPDVAADWTYPHTNYNSDFFVYVAAKHVMPNFVDGLTFHLEVGSFKAGSVTRLASLLKEKYSAWQQCSLVCIDPFSGDVNM